RKDDCEIGDSADHFHAFIKRTRRNIVIQDSSDNISPLGIGLDPVYILLRRAAVTHQYDLFLMKASPPHIPEKGKNQKTDAPFESHVDGTENINYQPGKIALLKHIKSKYDQQHSQDVGLDNIRQHQPAPLHVHRLI